MPDPFAKAKILYELGKFDQSAAFWVEELSRNPESALAHCQLAYSQLAMGHLDLALKSAKEGARLRPDWEFPYRVLARCHIACNQWSLARQAIMEALRIDPQDIYSLPLAAEIAAHFQQWLEALELLDRVLERDPTHLVARNLTTFVLVKAGNYPQAQAFNEETLRHHPENGYAQMMMGLKLWDLDRDNEAEACLDEALRLEPESDYFRRAKIRFVKSKSRFLSRILSLKNKNFSLLVRCFILVMASFLLVESFQYRKDPLNGGGFSVPFLSLIVFGTFGFWIADPLSDFFLGRSHQRLLSPREFLLSRWCAGLLFLSLLGILLMVILPRYWWVVGGFAFLLPLFTFFPVLGFFTLSGALRRWLVFPLATLMGLLFLTGGALMIWAVGVSPTISLGSLDKEIDARIWGIGLWEMIPFVAIPMGYLVKKDD